ncbi:MAG: ABC transporter substrate-binding protein [Labilithrix sp.]|nr:ABC transporter substrate-binding protein [Labilithrix sp.]MCW5816927.1 ABC transporter substrate-binding protein [Labilithrix sp.]
MGLVTARLAVVGACFACGAVAAASPLLGACAKEAPKPSAEPPITIGVSLGLTKGLASVAAPIRDAIRSAEGEINASGGLLGRRVVFDVVDDGSDEADLAKSVAQGFADRDVAAVIGPVGSGQVKATQDVLFQKQIIQISPSATSTELTTIQPAKDRYLFRTTPADDFQGAAVILFATKTPGGLGDAGVGAVGADAGVVGATCDKLALVYIDNAYGVPMAKVITDSFPKRGPNKEIVAELKVAVAPASSYADVVGPILEKKPQCMALITYDDVAAQFVADLKAAPGYAALDSGFFIIGTDGVYTSAFLAKSRQDEADDTSASTAEGVFGTNPDTQPGTSEYNRFRTIYSSYFPLRPTDDAPAFTANAFDAAVLIAFAIQKAGTATDRAAIRDALKEVSAPPGRPISPSEITEGLVELRGGGDIDYKGASGNVDFQSNGNVNGGFIVWQAVREATTKKIVYKTVARFTTEELVEQVR